MQASFPSNPLLRFSAWLLVVALTVWWLTASLRVSYDLGLFLPSPETLDEQVLVEQLGQGPGSRFLMLGLKDIGDQQFSAVSEALAENPLFSRVVDGELDDSAISVPETLERYVFHLSDTPLDRDSLALALEDRLADLSFIATPEFQQLIRQDPTLSALSVFEQLGRIQDADAGWITKDGVRVILLETSAPAFDLGAQAEAVSAIRNILANAEITSGFELSGAGAFGVELQETTRREATWRSMLASLALALVLLIAYRRWQWLVLGGVPMVTGALAGLVTVSLVFSEVHGITLAFGFTLLGIVIDYPLHLFSHARSHPLVKAIGGIWPTIGLGAISSLTAYLAIAVSGSQGLAQLGLFSAAGIGAAALATRTLVPAMSPDTMLQPVEPSPAPGQAFSWLPLALTIILAMVLLTLDREEPLWSNDLSKLSPLPDARLKRDNELRQAIGSPDMRYLLAGKSSELQPLLEATESLDLQLLEQAPPGAVDGWQTVTTLVPSESTQLRRVQRLPDDQTLTRALDEASDGTPFSSAAFTPFIERVAASRDLPLVSPKDWSGSPLEALVNTHLYRHGDHWTSIISLYGLRDRQQLSEWLKQNSDFSLVDLKAASESLVQRYRGQVMQVLTFAIVAIMLLLFWRLSLGRMAWTLATVAAALIMTVAMIKTMQGSLSLYHLIALLLVSGLGVDYALFLGREEDTEADRKNSTHAVSACAASTILTFSVLAMSDIPALNAIGASVAVGSALSYVLARWGRRHSV